MSDIEGKHPLCYKVNPIDLIAANTLKHHISKRITANYSLFNVPKISRYSQFYLNGISKNSTVHNWISHVQTIRCQAEKTSKINYR